MTDVILLDHQGRGDRRPLNVVNCLCLDPNDERFELELEKKLAISFRLALVSYMVRVRFHHPWVQTLPDSFESWYNLLKALATFEEMYQKFEDQKDPKNLRRGFWARAVFDKQLDSGEVSVALRNFLGSIYLYHFPANHEIWSLWEGTIARNRERSVEFALKYTDHLNKLLGPLFEGVAYQLHNLRSGVGYSAVESFRWEPRLSLAADMRKSPDGNRKNKERFSDLPTTPEMVVLPPKGAYRIAVSVRPITYTELKLSGRCDIEPSCATALLTADEANDYLAWLWWVTGRSYYILLPSDWREIMREDVGLLLGPCPEFLRADSFDRSDTTLPIARIRCPAIVRTGDRDIIVDATYGVAALRVARRLDDKS